MTILQCECGRKTGMRNGRGKEGGWEAVDGAVAEWTVVWVGTQTRMAQCTPSLLPYILSLVWSLSPSLLPTSRKPLENPG